MSFEPIAVVGRGCVLPGALDPDSFWENVLAGRTSLTHVPEGRWGVAHGRVMGDCADRTWTDVGGYVHGFESVFDPTGFRLDPGSIGELDRVFQWTLYGVREALRESGQQERSARTGLVLGNLSYPSAAAARYAEDVWLDGRHADPRPDARNRFCSGLPAQLAARALGFGAGGFALDAACASSLYAIKIACDRLQDARAELMIAGGVNASDNLNIHLGFCALGAMSRTGRSRPFHRDADGLVPAEGAAFVALMRLSDALAAGAPIHGVIRGAGLTNDGRAASLLSPAEQGQTRAMRLAFQVAGLPPQSVSLAECHATGTAAGDAVEVRSMAGVFGGCADLPIGSVKSNVGHLITAAGGASLLKVLGAMRAGVLPPTLNARQPLEDLTGTPLRLLHEAEEWRGPRRAAINAFGFGGTNAHLIVDAWDPDATRTSIPIRRTLPEPAQIAVVAVGARAGQADFPSALFQGGPLREPMEAVEVSLEGLRVPPSDLQEALAQQVLMLETVRDAVRGVNLPAQRTMVVVGAGCDLEGARYLARWRAPDPASQSAFAPPLNAAAVLGMMLNIVANRINAQLDLGGPGYTVCAEEASGLVAVELAARAIRAGEADAAVVGAVDLSAEPVHRAALRELGLDRVASDAAVVLVLKRRGDARRGGDPVIALLEDRPRAVPDLVVGDRHLGAHYDPAERFGSAHAVQGLLSLAVAALALHHRALPGQGPTPDLRTAQAVTAPLQADPVRVSLRAADVAAGVPADTAAPVGERPADRGAVLRWAAHRPPVVLPQPQPARLDPVLVAAVRHQGRIHELHQAFLTEQADFQALQAEVHTRFLQSRLRAEAAFLRVPARAATTFDRGQLERLATGRISAVFGPRFAPQDGHLHQTRLPAPPLLLVDRVTGLDALPASMGTGTIWTETDVRLDSWYLDGTGLMPPGLLVESGQADLLLISWLGVDLLNRGERRYRLLGCDLRFHGSPPGPGETVRHRIGVDRHAEHDGVRIFFFHSECRVGGSPRLTVRNGQAGFFTDQELAESTGVLWDPAASVPPAGLQLDPPAIDGVGRSFDHQAVRAFAAGHPADCFGPGWAATRAHIRSPRIDQGRMLLLGEVTELDPRGGPWGRGYLRAELPITPHDWFFDGHFLNDPCMPGTLMMQGALQAMAFYLAAMGFTIERDGWRFEPVPDETFRIRCRSQVTPASRLLVYEVFVSQMSAGPCPTLFADVLCSAGGIAALHGERLGLRLVPDWPLSHWRELSAPAVQKTGDPVPPATLGGLRGHRESKPVAEAGGIPYDYAAILASAWGRPTEAYGPRFAAFDGARRVARLPGPPYQFMTRVTGLETPPAGGEVGSRIDVDYDVPDEVWYFEQNGHQVMPLCVLSEVVLQPCGALAVAIGTTLGSQTDVFFRNLGGDITVQAEVGPQTRTLRTRVELRSHAQHDGMIIQGFDLECFADGQPVLSGSATFGFFPSESFDNQGGLPPAPAEQAAFAHPCDYLVDLTRRPARYCGGRLRLAGPMLLMLDRVTGYWPQGGAAGLGRLRAEKDVDAGEWFFKAHFFQDPVQPGSLGLESVCQLLQFYMIERNLGAGIADPRFEPVMTGLALSWKYRGQITPTDGRVTTEVEITRISQDDHGCLVTAQAWLWVDGRRIYQVQRIGMRIVSGSKDDTSPAVAEQVLDPRHDPWLSDHRPTWTVPALPMASVADLLARAATDYAGTEVRVLEDLQISGWLLVPGTVRIRTKAQHTRSGIQLTLMAWRKTQARWEPIATAVVPSGEQAPSSPVAFAPLADAPPQPDPYQTGTLFHGPSFQYLLSLRTGPAGASAVLDAGRGRVPRGLLAPGLLDAALHAIPHDRLWLWAPEIGHDQVGFPHRLLRLEIFERLPDEGLVEVEARFAGLSGTGPRLPRIDLQLQSQGRVLAAVSLVEALLPMGAFGDVTGAERRAFLRDLTYVNGLGISTAEGDETVLSVAELEKHDWLQGTVAHAYGLSPQALARDHLADIAIKDHVGRLRRVHPSRVQAQAERHRLQVIEQDGTVRVRSVSASTGDSGGS